jgi:hypothetical protein
MDAVRQVIAAYAEACDEARLEDWRATFLDDGVLETAEVVYRGGEIDLLMTTRVATKLRERAEGRRTRHHLTTQRITPDADDAAHACTYFQLVRNGEIEEAGLYRDRLRRDDAGVWRLAHRVVTVEYRSDAAPSPERPIPPLAPSAG